MCDSVASTPELNMDVRMKHYNEMVNALQNSTAGILLKLLILLLD